VKKAELEKLYDFEVDAAYDIMSKKGYMQ